MSALVRVRARARARARNRARARARARARLGVRVGVWVAARGEHPALLEGTLEVVQPPPHLPRWEGWVGGCGRRGWDGICKVCVRDAGYRGVSRVFVEDVVDSPRRV